MSDEAKEEVKVIKRRNDRAAKELAQANEALFKKAGNETTIEREIRFPSKTKIKIIKVREFKGSGKKGIVKRSLMGMKKK